jgi:hypothetical protein
VNAVKRYSRAGSWHEALELRDGEPGARWLAGGTALLAGDGRDKPDSVIDLGSALPRAIELVGGELSIGACATFQDIAAAPALPRYLVDAALTMVNRNTRNRATLGGNLGADKSCSSLIPLLIALDARGRESPRLQLGRPRTSASRHWLDGRAEEPRARASDLGAASHPACARRRMRGLPPLEPGLLRPLGPRSGGRLSAWKAIA